MLALHYHVRIITSVYSFAPFTYTWPAGLCCFINSLWPSDIKWRRRSWSTLAQVMACWHYLNQCWVIISEVFRPPPEQFHWKCIMISFLDISFKITDLKLQPHFPGANELKLVQPHACPVPVKWPWRIRLYLTSSKLEQNTEIFRLCISGCI